MSFEIARLCKRYAAVRTFESFRSIFHVYVKFFQRLKCFVAMTNAFESVLRLDIKQIMFFFEVQAKTLKRIEELAADLALYVLCYLLVDPLLLTCLFLYNHCFLLDFHFPFLK